MKHTSRFLAAFLALVMLFSLVAVPVVPASAAVADLVDGQIYRIVAKHSNKALTVENNSTQGGALIIQQTIDESNTAQQWKLVKNGDYFNFVNVNSGMALDNPDGTTNEDTRLAQWDSTTWNNNQKWSIFDTGDGYYHIAPYSSSALAVNIQGGWENDGDDALLWTYSGADHEKFSFVPVTRPIEEPNAVAAIDAFINEFYYTQNGMSYISNVPGNFFWQEAEMIEMLIDAYERIGDVKYLTMAKQHYASFIDRKGADWEWNEYNDDIMWACIASARLYLWTLDEYYLDIAVDNFNMCWDRAWDTSFAGGGLWWKQDEKQTKNACIEGPAAIAACFLGQATGDESYYEKAKTLVQWEVDHLLQNDGGVWDNINVNGGESTWISTYNQGTFIGACTLLFKYTNEQKYYSWATSAANRATRLGNGNGILDGEDNTDDLIGFKGILGRWLGLFIRECNVTAYDSFMYNNAKAAWNNRNSEDLMWTKFDTDTAENPGNGGNSAWGCSAAVAWLVNTLKDSPVKYPIKVTYPSENAVLKADSVTVTAGTVAKVPVYLTNADALLESSLINGTLSGIEVDLAYNANLTLTGFEASDLWADYDWSAVNYNDNTGKLLGFNLSLTDADVSLADVTDETPIGYLVFNTGNTVTVIDVTMELVDICDGAANSFAEYVTVEDFTVTTTDPHEHTAGAAVVENKVEATCTENGSYDSVIYCSLCGGEMSRETVTIPATGHDWNAGVVIKQPTLTETGLKVYTCGNCNETKTEIIPVKVEPTVLKGGDMTVEAGSVVRVPVYLTNAANLAELAANSSGSIGAFSFNVTVSDTLVLTGFESELLESLEPSVGNNGQVFGFSMDAGVSLEDISDDEPIGYLVFNTGAAFETTTVSFSNVEFFDELYVSYSKYIETESFTITATAHEEPAVEYKFGQTVNLRVVEPWGLKANTRVYTDGINNIDYNALYDYGVYFLRASELDRAGLTQSTITIEDIINDADVTHQTKGNGVVVEGDRLSAIYDKNLYTYQFDDHVFVLYYIVTEKGADPIYAPIRERDLLSLLDTGMNQTDFSENERSVYRYMKALYEDSTAYRATFDEIPENVVYDAPTLAEYKLGTPSTASIYNFSHTNQLYMIEPWGVKLNARVYTDGINNIDYSALEEFGAVVLYDDDAQITTQEELLARSDAYVFSSANGDATVDGSNRISATFNNGVYTYQLDTNMTVMFYVKDASGYHFGPIKVRNIHDLMETGLTSSGSTELEKAIYTDMLNLYEAATAYRAEKLG